HDALPIYLLFRHFLFGLLAINSPKQHSLANLLAREDVAGRGTWKHHPLLGIRSQGHSGIIPQRIVRVENRRATIRRTTGPLTADHGPRSCCLALPWLCRPVVLLSGSLVPW